MLYIKGISINIICIKIYFLSFDLKLFFSAWAVGQKITVNLIMLKWYQIVSCLTSFQKYRRYCMISSYIGLILPGDRIMLRISLLWSKLQLWRWWRWELDGCERRFWRDGQWRRCVSTSFPSNNSKGHNPSKLFTNYI